MKEKQEKNNLPMKIIYNDKRLGILKKNISSYNIIFNNKFIENR